MFCPISNKLPKSFYKLMKMTTQCEYKLKHLEFCQSCKSKLTKNKKCTNRCCQQFSSQQSSFDCFTYVNLIYQIRNTIEKNYKEIIEYKKSKRNFKDILDGESYKRKDQNCNENTICLIVYTDGVQVTKNSTIEVWPIICSIIELPPLIRNSVKNK
jgi:hypothetical protein